MVCRVRDVGEGDGDGGRSVRIGARIGIGDVRIRVRIPTRTGFRFGFGSHDLEGHAQLARPIALTFDDSRRSADTVVILVFQREIDEGTNALGLHHLRHRLNRPSHIGDIGNRGNHPF